MSVVSALGLNIKVVLPSPSWLNVLCSIGQLELLTGHRLEKITGPGLLQCSSGRAVFLRRSAMALLICDRCMLPMLATRQFILLVVTELAEIGLGETIFILSNLRAALENTTRTCLSVRSVLLIICMQAIMLWHALQIELKTSVWVVVLGLFPGVGTRVMILPSRVLILLLAPVSMRSMLEGE